MYILLSIIAVLGVWSIFGFLSSNVEHLSYTVVETHKGYEVRLYSSHIVAETTVSGSYRESLNEGFSIVAAYIFGANAKKESIAMTAPVIEQKESSEKIPMTAPVIASLGAESHTVAFSMPASYSLETLPKPTDSRVAIRAVPERRMAAMRFSWLRTNAHVETQKQRLLDALERDEVRVVGEVQYAGYNAPWTPPWMIRNEVLVEVE